jgi:hypothetical protein
MAVNLLKQEKTVKNGTESKRLLCGWDTNYLLKVLLSGEYDAIPLTRRLYNDHLDVIIVGLVSHLTLLQLAGHFIVA